MTVLVTGATGFLGGHCVRSLAQKTAVLATGRDEQTLAKLAGLPNVSATAADLADPACVDRLAARRPTAIVHAAAFSSLWGRSEDFHSANVIGTRHVLDIAERCDADLVHISTPTIYMDGTDRTNVNESSPRPARGVNDYAETKRVAEIDVRARTSVRSVILRPQGIVGAGDTAVAPRFLRVMRRGFFPLINQGRARSELTHVANAVEAVELALAVEKSHGETQEFNVTNGEPMSTRELLNLFLDARRQYEPGARPVRFLAAPEAALRLTAQALERTSRRTGGWEPPITSYSVEVLSRDRTFDIEASRRQLGYDPSGFSIRDAFDDFFAHRSDPSGLERTDT